jgi:hypothetical protein
LIYARFHNESRSFRVGCIGQIQPEWVDDFLDETAAFVRSRRTSRTLPSGSVAGWPVMEPRVSR